MTQWQPPTPNPSDVLATCQKLITITHEMSPQITPTDLFAAAIDFYVEILGVQITDETAESMAERMNVSVDKLMHFGQAAGYILQER